MQTNVNNYYELLSLGLGQGNKGWQEFVDHFKEKYNEPQTAGFVFDNEIQLDYTYQQLQVDLNIATLPVYMDPDAEALDKKRGSFAINMGSIPTQKHRYNIDTRILREKMILAQKFGSVGDEAKDAILNLLYDSTDKLIQGNRNALTHQRMQVVSTGKFTIGADNNPRGITGVTLDFGAKELTANAGTSRWWSTATHTPANEGAASDPIGEIKAQLRTFRALGYPDMQVEMSQVLFDDLLGHTKVQASIGFIANPMAADSAAAAAFAIRLSDEDAKAYMEKAIGCPIKVWDTMAKAEAFDASSKDLKTVDVTNFEPKNIAYVPQGQIGTIKSVQQIVIADDPTTRVAWFDGGRTLISQAFDKNTAYITSEMAMLTVPNMPQYMSYKTVTA